MSAEHPELLFRSHPLLLCLKSRSQVNQKGAVTVLVVILMVVLLGCAALAVDMGHLYVIRTELQRTADAAALAGASQLPSLEATRAEAKTYAGLSSPNQGEVLADSDVLIGYWNSKDRTFSPWVQPYNAVKVLVQRSQTNGNPVDTFLGGFLGIAQCDVSASAVALGSPSNPAFRFLIDDEMFDTDVPAVEDLADDLGLDPDEMLTGEGPYKWINIPAGTILELPTGQVGDEGIFDAQEDFPFTESSSTSLEDFLLEDGLSDDDLDPLVGVEPVSDDSMYASFVNPDAILVSPLFKSDVSEIDGGVNAKGERRGLVAFQIIGIGDDPDGGGSCLPNLIIRIVSTSDIDLDEVTVGSGSGSGSLQLVQ